MCLTCRLAKNGRSQRFPSSLRILWQRLGHLGMWWHLGSKPREGRLTSVSSRYLRVLHGAFTTCASSCVFQAEVCAGTVAEVIQSVVNGADGCVFCFGHAKLGE